jgi:hypothetical protein
MQLCRRRIGRISWASSRRLSKKDGVVGWARGADCLTWDIVIVGRKIIQKLDLTFILGKLSCKIKAMGLVKSGDKFIFLS